MIFCISGDEKFEFATEGWFRGADGVIVLVDVTDQESLGECDRWIRHARK